MMVSADARYPKRVYLRADQEFTDKVNQIRCTHGLKSSSSAIRYAVDYTVTFDMEKEHPGNGIPSEGMTDAKRLESRAANCADAETVRRISTEIETLARDGRKRGYLSEEQVAILLAYHRELSRSVRKLAGMDG